MSHRRLMGAALAIPALGGCLERTITVTTEPPGAVVWMNDQEIGRTPVETGFTFYGTYELRIRKEGFEPIVTQRKASAPWYEYPGPDLVASALPFRIRTALHWHFDLSPQAHAADPDGARADLLERARAFRSELPFTERTEAEEPSAPR